VTFLKTPKTRAKTIYYFKLYQDHLFIYKNTNMQCTVYAVAEHFWCPMCPCRRIYRKL